MIRFLSLLFLLASIPAFALDRVVITLTLTNPPVVGDTLTVNSSTRTWTNSASSSTIQTNATIAGSATNLFAHFGSYGVSGVYVSQSASNVLLFTGLPGVSMSASLLTGWGTISYSTNTITESQVVRVPLSVEATAERTNIASQLIRDLGSYSPTPFATGSVAMSLHMDLPSAQTVTGAKIFSSITTTGLVNRGSAISSPGSVVTAEQFGDDSIATNSFALAVGFGASAGGSASTAIGYAAFAVGGNNSIAIGAAAVSSAEDTLSIGVGTFATADSAMAIGNAASGTGTNAIAIGASSDASGTSSIAIGTTSEAGSGGIAMGDGSVSTGERSLAIGQNTSATHYNSAVIGYNLSSTTSNEFRIGNSAQLVRVAGTLSPAVVTNATYYGTIGLLSSGTISSAAITSPTVTLATMSNTVANGTTDVTGLQLPRNTHTTLANGANRATFTNTFTRISAGPTASFSIAGISDGADGRAIILYNSTGQNMTISHESGTEATASNRIITMTGSDVATTGNGSFILIYDSSASRWILVASEL